MRAWEREILMYQFMSSGEFVHTSAIDGGISRSLSCTLKSDLLLRASREAEARETDFSPDWCFQDLL